MSTVAGSPSLPGAQSTSEVAKPVRQFRRNVLSSAGGNVVNIVLQLGLLYLLHETLTTAAYAMMLTATALIGVSEMASDYGSRLWATREFSFTARPVRILRLSAWCKVFYTIVSAAVLTLLPLNNLTLPIALLCFAIASTQPSTDPFLWYLRGRERLDVEAAIMLVSRTLAVTGMALAAWMQMSIPWLLTIWLLTNIGRMGFEATLSCVRPVFGDGTAEEAADDRGRSMSSVSVVLREVFPVGTTLFLTSLFQRIGVLLLSIFATDLDVSVFGTAFRLVSTAGFLSTSMFVSSFAALVRAIEINDVRSVGRIVRREMHLVSLVFVPACLLGILFCIPLTRALLPADMLPVAQAMVILCPGLYLSCINMGMKYTVNAWSLNWPDVVAVVIGILIFADSIWMFSHISWSVGAAIGWGAGEGGVLLLRIALLRYAGKPSGVPVASILMSTCVLVVAAFWAIH
ncbi:MAG: hypothetical protein R3C20_20195 [Planctomycetaceae bacterium]